MLAFEVHLNGNKKCVAGIGEPGVLTTTLTWVLGQPKGRRKSGEDMWLHVGGLISRNYEFVDWFQRKVRRGDEVVIRIVEVGAADAPRKRRQESPAQRRRQQQAYVRKMAKQFGWKIQKS